MYISQLLNRIHFVSQTLSFSVQSNRSDCSPFVAWHKCHCSSVTKVRHIHRSFTRHLKMFVPQAAIVTHTRRFPTHCTPTPPACKFSGTACADRQPFTVHVPTTCSSATTFFFSPTEDTTSWWGRMECTGPVRTVPRAPLSLTAPSHDAAVNGGWCRALLLSFAENDSFILSLHQALRLVQRSCRDR